MTSAYTPSTMRVLPALLIMMSLVLVIQARADFALREPMKVSDGLQDWIDQILEATDKYGPSKLAEPDSGYTECAPTEEIEHTYLCASYRQTTMNSVFERATYYVEQDSKILRLDDPQYRKLTESMGGHDLQAADLVAFYTALNDACEGSNHEPSLCPTPAEEEVFEKFILPQAESEKNFVVIAFGILSDTDPDTVVTHEIMHAQYFNDPNYREIADKFWDATVSKGDREKTRKILAPFYDPKNELLMRNEFQAYILMTHAERNMLSALVPKYRKHFFDKMKEGGVVPIQLE